MPRPKPGESSAENLGARSSAESMDIVMLSYVMMRCRKLYAAMVDAINFKALRANGELLPGPLVACLCTGTCLGGFPT